MITFDDSSLNAFSNNDKRLDHVSDISMPLQEVSLGWGACFVACTLCQVMYTVYHTDGVTCMYHMSGNVHTDGVTCTSCQVM